MSDLARTLTTGARLLAAFRTGGLPAVAGLLGGVFGAHVLPPLPERVVLPPPVMVEEGYTLRPGETAMTLDTLEAITSGHRARGRAEGREEGIRAVLHALEHMPETFTADRAAEALRHEFDPGEPAP